MKNRYIKALLHTHIPSYRTKNIKNTNIPKYTQARIQAYEHRDINKNKHTDRHKSKVLCDIHTYTHEDTHKHIRLYSHTHKH